eukprot:gene54219-41825_t
MGCEGGPYHRHGAAPRRALARKFIARQRAAAGLRPRRGKSPPPAGWGRWHLPDHLGDAHPL